MVWYDLQVLLIKLEQILHLKVDCSDFGPVQDRGRLPYSPGMDGKHGESAEHTPRWLNAISNKMAVPVDCLDDNFGWLLKCLLIFSIAYEQQSM